MRPHQECPRQPHGIQARRGPLIGILVGKEMVDHGTARDCEGRHTPCVKTADPVPMPQQQHEAVLPDTVQHHGRDGGHEDACAVDPEAQPRLLTR